VSFAKTYKVCLPGFAAPEDLIGFGTPGLAVPQYLIGLGTPGRAAPQDLLGLTKT